MAYYDIKASPIYKDIKKVIDKSEASTYDITAILSTVKKDINIRIITDLTITRDYYNSLSDNGYVTVRMTKGDFIYDVYPYRDNLELSLKFTKSKTEKRKLDKTIVHRFKAISLEENQRLVNNFLLGKNFDKKILLDLIDVTFQILDRRIEPFRIKTIQGIFRDITVNKLLKSVISSNANLITVDGKPILNSLDIVKPDNNNIYKQIIIPSGFYLSELPNYLHEHLVGIYSSGLGSYLQSYKNNFTWFIYPLFNTKRVTESEHMLIIYEVDSSALTELDKIYYVDNNKVFIIANGDKVIIDSGESDMMNKGSGFRSAAAKSFMKKPISIENGKLIAKRSNLNNEVIIKNRNDGLNYAPVKASPVDNTYTYYSEVLLRSLSRIDFTWSNSDPELLYPGMTCKYIKAVNNKVKETTGTLIFANTVTMSNSSKEENIIYRHTTQLSILTEPFGDFNDVSKK